MIKPLTDRRGVTALEFAIVAPFFLTLVLGMMYGSYMLFSSNALQYAAQEGARCASVNPTKCPNGASAKTYAMSRYAGFGKPTFTHSVKECGNSIDATLTYSWNIALFSSSTPLSASACFPSS